VGELVLLGLGTEAEGVDRVDDLAEVVAAGDAVLQLAEDLADLALDGVGAGGALLEALEVGEEVVVVEVDMRSGPLRALWWSRVPSAFLGAT
jgi:uncharacterized protein with PhoU and TrkA domain